MVIWLRGLLSFSLLGFLEGNALDKGLECGEGGGDLFEIFLDESVSILKSETAILIVAGVVHLTDDALNESFALNFKIRDFHHLYFLF